MFTILFIALNVPSKSFVLNVLGYNESYLLQIDVFDKSVTIDILYMKKPILKLIDKIKEIVKKLRSK